MVDGVFAKPSMEGVMTTDEMRDQQYAKTLQRLIRMETVSVEGDRNTEKFERFHSLLQELFPNLFDKSDIENFSGSLLMRWPGECSEKPVLLMSHHDVVEAVGNWSHGPFSGDIEDGKLWGRGSLDTKCSLWAMLQAAEELAAEGFRPKQDVWFVSTCTEETDGSGADTISQELQKRGVEFSMVLDEGGFILHDPIGGADHDFAMVGVGEKGCADLRFVARSKGGHASMPGKDTPLVRLGKFMAEAERSALFPPRMDAVTEEMLRRCGRYVTGVTGVLLRNIRFFKPLLTRVLPRVSNAAGAMLKTTIAFTMAGCSQGRNVLPQEAWVVGNMRFSIHQGQQSSFEAIRKVAAKYDIEMEILDPGFESPVSDFRTPEFRKIEQAVSAIFGDVVTVPYIMTGASDCRYFSRVSRNCFRFAPFAISNEQLASIHGVDENITISGIHRAVDFYKYIIKEI